MKYIIQKQFEDCIDDNYCFLCGSDSVPGADLCLKCGIDWEIDGTEVIPRKKQLKLYTENEVCRELNIPVGKFRYLRRRKWIPFVHIGYRTFRYDILEVRNALKQL